MFAKVYLMGKDMLKVYCIIFNLVYNMGGKQDQNPLDVCQCLTYEKWYAHSSLIIECLEFMGKDMVTAYLIIFDHI